MRQHHATHARLYREYLAAYNRLPLRPTKPYCLTVYGYSIQAHPESYTLVVSPRGRTLFSGQLVTVNQVLAAILIDQLNGG